MQSDPDRLYEIWQRLKNLSPQELPQSANTNELLLENVTRLFEAYEHSPAGYVNLYKRGRIVSSNLTFCSFYVIAGTLKINFHLCQKINIVINH